MIHLLRCLLVSALLSLAGLLVPAPSSASAATVPGLAISANEATPEFPEGITFSLSASAAVPVERVELLYSIAGQETLNMATPEFLRGSTIDANFRLDARTRYIPPGLDLAYHWRLTDAAGNVSETEPRTMTWQDNRFDWTSVATEQVTVYAYNGDEDFNRAVLESAQRTIDELQATFRVERGAPIRIWAYASVDDFAGAQAPNSHPWIVGTAFPDYRLILAVLPVGDTDEVGRVIPHEVTHQVLHQATANPFNEPPTWMDEGLAVYYQDGGTQAFPDLVEAAAEDGRLYSVRALNSQFPYDKPDADLAYAESFSIVSFIIEEFGEEAMGALIQVFAEGISHDEAVQRALGVSMDELDRRWKASLGYEGDRMAPGAATSENGGSNPSSPSPDSRVAPATGAFVMAAAAILAVISGAIVIKRAHGAALEGYEASG